MKLSWITDIHLNFLNSFDRQNFYQKLANNNTDAVLISGDIADALTVSDILIEITQYVDKPIYFILGNHDYYHGSVAKLRKSISNLCQQYDQLHWLPQSKGVALTQDVLLLGEDCWADGRYGNYSNSSVTLNDSRMIKELHEGSILGKYQLLKAMQKLADSDADHLKVNLESAICRYHPKKLIILIHIPPFVESCMHEGQISDDNYLPFFSSKVTGDVLLNSARQNPEIEFLVLCGHTHSESYHQPLPNLTVKAGSSEYMFPEIQEIIRI